MQKLFSIIFPWEMVKRTILSAWQRVVTAKEDAFREIHSSLSRPAAELAEAEKLVRKSLQQFEQCIAKIKSVKQQVRNQWDR